MEAIVLAGGFGTRLRKAVSTVPKPMAPINDQPFLTYVFNFLRRHGISRAVVATGYLHEVIQGYYGNRFGDLQIDYSVEEEPLGTGGALKQALQRVRSELMLVMNGDTFFDVDVSEMVDLHRHYEADLTMALKPMKRISRYGVVTVEHSRVVGFEEKQERKSGYINGGIYLMNRTVFDRFDLPQKFSLEADFLKAHAGSLNIQAYLSDAYFIDIGVPEDYHRAQRELNRYE